MLTITRSLEKNTKGYLEEAEETRIVDAEKILREIIALGVDPRDLEPRDYGEEIRYYRLMGERERKRLSMTQVKQCV